MRTVALLAAVLAVSGVSSLVTVSLSEVSTLYLPTLTPGGGAPTYPTIGTTLEQLSIHLETKVLYGVGDGVIHVIDASDVTNLTSLDHVLLPDLELSDVEVCGDGVLVTYRNSSQKLQGGVLLYRLYNTTEQRLELIRDIPMGSLPDMILPSPGCEVAVVAVENEMVEQGGEVHDPPGGVGIIRFPQGLLAPPTVKLLNFTAFDDRFEELAAQGVRWVYRENNASFSDNIEPEYVAFNHDYTKAYLTLQENNAIAVVDLMTDNITDIHGLGFKEWGDLDPSDRDGGIHLGPWSIRGMYQPDSLGFVRWGGSDYLITANEGGELETPPSLGFSEEARGKKLDNFATSFPQTLKDALKDDTKLGRLTFSALRDGRDEGGALHTLYAFGARSFSVWRADDMTQVYDSGSDIERRTAQLRPDIFNANGGDEDTLAEKVDTRSDNKGAEPETITTGVVGDHLLIFVACERPGSILVYSAAPGGMLPEFQSLYTGVPPNSSNRTFREMHANRELSIVDPEYMHFFSPSAGLADYPVLLVAGSVSGTVSVLRVHVTDDPAGQPTTAGPASAASCLLAYLPSSIILSLFVLVWRQLAWTGASL